MKFSDIKIAVKIPALVCAAALFSIICVTTISILKSSSDLEKQSGNQLLTLVDSRAETLSRYLKDIADSLLAVSTSENV